MKKINGSVLKKFRKMPISTKITVIYALIFSIIFIVSAAFLLVNAWLYYRSASKSEVNEVLDTIEEYIENGGEVNDKEIAELVTNKYMEVHVTKVTDDFNSDAPFDVRPSLPPDDNDFTPRIRRDDYDMRMIKNKPYMWSQRVVEYDGNKYVVQVFRPYSSEKRVLTMFFVIFVVVSCIAVFVAYVAGKSISCRILKPVENITQTAKTISINDLQQRIDVPEADDEIKTLAITFNDMISRLQESFEKQNRFVSDASHELRTPIAVIQGYADLIDRWGKEDEEVLQEAITSIKTETANMSELINQLLFLARGDKAAKSVEKENINISLLAAEVVKEASMTNSEVDIGLEVAENAENTEIFADYTLIKQLLRIFVDNAVKYGNKTNPIVNLKVEKEDDEVKISVADNGIGISAEDKEHIFDRFFRGDKSRNKEISGNGLGLSIAKWIIDQHNASVEVESKVGEGSCFIVTFDCSEIPKT
jgi:signal transduction histidine kinase